MTSKGTFTLRPAQAEDSKAIRKLIHEVGINPLGLDWQRFLLAVDSEGNMIGCGQVKPHRDGSRELASVAVQPGWRHHGVASALIQQLLAENPRPLFLTCRDELGPFYAQFGFHEVETENLPSYFKRIMRLVEFLHRRNLFPRRLLVMKLERRPSHRVGDSLNSSE